MPEEQKEQKKEKKKRVYPKRINEPKTCDEVLDIIKNFIATDTSKMEWPDRLDFSKQRDNLWQYLTSLRGPDFIGKDDNSSLDKKYYTAVLRSRILRPEEYNGVGADVYLDSQEAADHRKKTSDCSNFYHSHPHGPHFYDHAEKAFDAIGWDVNKVNPPKKEEGKATTNDKPKKQ